MNKLRLRNGTEETGDNVFLTGSVLEMIFDQDQGVFIELVEHARTQKPLSIFAKDVLNTYGLLDSNECVHKDALHIADAMAEQDGGETVIVHPVTGEKIEDGSIEGYISAPFLDDEVQTPAPLPKPEIELSPGDKRFWIPAPKLIQ